MKICRYCHYIGPENSCPKCKIPSRMLDDGEHGFAWTKNLFETFKHQAALVRIEAAERVWREHERSAKKNPAGADVLHR